jgi:hypothetical protein
MAKFPKLNVSNTAAAITEPIMVGTDMTLAVNHVYYVPAGTRTLTLPAVQDNMMSNDWIHILVVAGALVVVRDSSGIMGDVICYGPVDEGVTLYRFLLRNNVYEQLNWVQFSEYVTPIYPPSYNARRIINWNPVAEPLSLTNTDFLNNAEIVVMAAPEANGVHNDLILDVTDITELGYNRLIFVNETNVLNKLAIKLSDNAHTVGYRMLYNNIATYRRAAHTTSTPAVLEFIRYDYYWNCIVRSGTWTWSS